MKRLNLKRWSKLQFWNSPAWKKIRERLEKEDSNGIHVIPGFSKLFRPLILCPYEKVKVVIISNDMQTSMAVSDGFPFSCQPHCKAKNRSYDAFRRELYRDTGIRRAKRKTLAPWAARGVLLINEGWSATVGKPDAHKKLGWWKLNMEIINKLSYSKKNLVFILMGRSAYNYRGLIDTRKHLVLITDGVRNTSKELPPYNGSSVFTKTNAYLAANGIQPIDWRLP